MALRAWELEHDLNAYEKANPLQAHTSAYGRGGRDSLGFAIALLMKYRHQTPSCTLGEIHAALDRLDKKHLFDTLRNTEPMPVPNGIA